MEKMSGRKTSWNSILIGFVNALLWIPLTLLIRNVLFGGAGCLTFHKVELWCVLHLSPVDLRFFSL